MSAGLLPQELKRNGVSTNSEYSKIPLNRSGLKRIGVHASSKKSSAIGFICSDENLSLEKKAVSYQRMEKQM